MSTIVMKVRRVVTDALTGLPSLVLVDERAGAEYQLAIGVHDAPAIASELSHVELDRPLPHDLIKAILGRCGAAVTRVDLAERRGGTVVARIGLRMPGPPGDSPEVAIDARPSDAIGVALRTGAEIHLPRSMLDRQARRRRREAAHDRAYDARSQAAAALADVGSWLLESIPDEDFGKWKM